MNAGIQPAARLLEDHEILGELLHSVSQPLTSLCCSLELSVEKAAGQQQEAVAAALEQAERVIEQVRLLREYLDAELPFPPAQPIRFAPMLRAVVEELSSVAAVNNVEMRLLGSSSATIALAEPRLHLALQYLLSTVIEMQPPSRTIILHLEERSSESVLYGKIESGSSLREHSRLKTRRKNDAAALIAWRVRLAIAARILESSGTAVLFENAESEFFLRIPHANSLPV